jgi:hypothetical protein
VASMDYEELAVLNHGKRAGKPDLMPGFPGK